MRPQTAMMRGGTSQQMCPFCETHIVKSDSFEYTMKTIIKVIDVFTNGDSGDTGSCITPAISLPSKLKGIWEKAYLSEYSVPMPLKQLYPFLTLDGYKQKLQDPVFMYQNVSVCSQCYNFVKTMLEYIEPTWADKPKRRWHVRCFSAKSTWMTLPW